MQIGYALLALSSADNPCSDEGVSMKSGRIPVTQLTLPKGGGALRAIGETFQSNAFTGTASLSIPVHVSPCRGSEPSISLDYSSGAGNGPFGLGFTLTLPSISCKTSKGLPRYDETDTYLLANTDDLVPIIGSQRDSQVDGTIYRVTAYHPRTEGLFTIIERWINLQTGMSHWCVIGRDNATSLFGLTENSRVSDPQKPTNIFQWLLAKTFDAEGNQAVYEYASENSDNLPAAIYELNRSQTANKYIQRIAYGNTVPFQVRQDTTPEWHFEVVFDYGEYSLEATNLNPYRPVRAWPARQDSFSAYHAGFEIRTHRLCRNVLMFHRFAELGSDPVLVHATRFFYDESPTMTLLHAVESTGYRYESGQYHSRSMPRLEFGYTEFQAAGGRFDLLEGRDLIPPSLNGSPNHQFVDLFGEGIPGLLYSDGRAAIYWEPEDPGDKSGQHGGARYRRPQPLSTLPIHASRQAMHPRLIDLAGDGQIDLLVSTATDTGYYEASPDRSWRPFRALPALPTDFHHPDSHMVDMTGDGLADVLLIESDQIRVYPSLGEGGFGPAIVRPREHGVPFLNRAAPDQAVLFADMFGSGAQHLVRISNGKVECWPNLGYGRFGAPVLLANAPYFGAELDPARLFLADLDGSGTADLIYFHQDRAEIFFNQSGNSFADPVELRLPSAWDRLDQIEFADVYGNGSACLVFTERHPQPRHWCYDFSRGRKPYLLNQIDNNLGARSTIAYCSSTQFYLADKRRGAPWLDHLPFPVQVVERVESYDLIAQTRLVSTYAYHHGCYDGTERVFRGFGMVERQDAERLSADAESTDVPPVLTKTWFHTGTFRQAGCLSRQYEGEYFWEAQACQMADSSFEQAQHASEDDWRGACRALTGAVLREEIYAPTAPVALPEQDPSAPYNTTEMSYCVRMLQPKAGNTPAVYFVYPRETLSYSYERNPADPRIQHEFVLYVDEYGNVLETCHVAYSRRDVPDAYPEQQQLKVTATAATVINLDRAHDPAGAHLLGLPREERAFEIGGLAAPPEGYLSFEQVRSQLNAARANEIAFEQALSGAAPQARLLEWQQHYYWNASLTEVLPLGQASPQALPHHSQAATFSPAQLQQVFGDKVSSELLQGAGGYVLQGGYWWNSSAIAHYYGAADFFLPWKTTDPFGAETVVAYDRHWLLPQTITDALGNVTRADQLDYHVLLPQRLIDMNDNVSEVRFDPLGSVIAASTYGTEDGKPKGDAALNQYAPLLEANLQAIMANPAQYLQQATSYFFYDPFAWQNDRQPPYALSLQRETHASDLAPGAATRIHVGIAYSDGFGRAVQSKGLVEPGQAFLRDADGSLRRDPAGTPIEGPTDERWLVSGRTVYNNKSAAVKQYEPFYSTTARYEPERELAEYGVTPVLHYDALLRLVRVDTPKGFFSKVEFTPWQEKHYDENDTLKDSTYYQQFMASYPAQPTEAQKYDRDALDKAAACYNTPQTTVFDSAGNPFLSIQDNLGRVPEDAFKEIVAGPSASNALWALLIDQGYLARDRDDPQSAWATSAFQPYRAGFKEGFIAGLPDAHKPSGEAIVDLLRQSCLTAHQAYDILGRAIESADPRLYYANVTQGTTYYNFKHVYAMDGSTLTADSADAGLNLSLNNAAGSFLWNRSARNFDQLIAYDPLQRPISIRVKGIKNDGTIATDNLVETFVYGEDQPRAKDLNLRGQLYQRRDQSGTIVNSRYSLHGALLETTRQLAQDYKDYISWDKAVPMDAERYTSRVALNALQQVISATAPDGSVTLNTYNQAGALDRVAVRLKNGTQQPIVDHIEYNAKGQRAAIAYANGVTTTYAYEPTTMRLTRLYSTRSGRDARGKPRQAVLQDIAYTYDPVGNITRTFDTTYQTVFYNNQKVDPLSNYTYDALYRLIRASGRQHPGINATTERNNQAEGSFKHSRYLPLPGDSAKLENYYQAYSYDEAGNLVKLAHIASNAWTRRLEVMPDSNRLRSVRLGSDAPWNVTYDRSGNQAQLDINSTIGLTWSCCETLRKAAIIQRPGEPDDSDYYTYNGDELRTRKVSERLAGGGAVIQREEKRYLGSYEVKIVQNGQSTILKRHTLRVMDDQTCVAILHTWEQDDTKREVDSAGTRRLRYQLDDHLGSAALQLSEDAEIISYEEYYPYGGTALIAGRNQREVKLKEYRYSGKERDDATGLYYYGARYYAPWLCRWLSTDPAGAVDGPNLYAFVGGNPLNYNDNHGEQKRAAHHSFEIFNAQGLGNADANKRRRVYAQTPPQMPGTHYSVATEVMATAADHAVLSGPFQNNDLMDPFHGTGSRPSMNYLAPPLSVVRNDLVPPADILNYLQAHEGIPLNVTTIAGIHGSKSPASSHRNPVRMPGPPGIFQYGIHSRSGGSKKALRALVAQAFALRDLNPAAPMHLSGDLNQTATDVQALITAIELAVPARARQLRVVAPPNNTHITRSTGHMRRLDFTITNIHPNDITVTAGQPSGRPGTSDHGRLRVTLVKNPRVGPHGGPWPGPSPEP